MTFHGNPVSRLAEYELRHLASHLDSRGEAEKLHWLLALETAQSRNAWYEAKQKAGDTTGFMSDVERAWRLSENWTVKHHSSLGIGIGLQCRYALITSSLNSLARNIPPELLDLLLKRGVWSLEQALTYARQTPYPKQQAEALLVLSQNVFGVKKEEILQEALAIAWTIQGTRSPAQIIAQIASNLPEPQRTDIMKEALVFGEAGMNEARAESYISLAPFMPESLMDELVEGVRKIKKPYRRAIALSGIVPYLPKQTVNMVIEEAAQLTKTVTDEGMQVQLLTILAPYLSKSMLLEALQLSREMKLTSARIGALASLVPWVEKQEPGESIEEVLRALPLIQEESFRINALASLIQHLSNALLPIAIEVADSVSLPHHKAKMFEVIAPYLPEPLLEQVFHLVLKIEDEKSQAFALSALSAYLPVQYIHNIFTVVQKYQQNEAQIIVLAKLVTRTPDSSADELLNETLISAQAILDEDYQVRALSKLSSLLINGFDREIQEKVYSKAKNIRSPILRIESLLELVPSLQGLTREKVLNEILDSLRLVSRSDERVRLAKRAFVYIDKKKSRTFIHEIITELRSIRKESKRVEMLTELISQLSPKLLPQYIEIAQAIVSPFWRTLALVALLPYCELAERNKLLESAYLSNKLIVVEYQKTIALSKLAPYMDEKILIKAISETKKLKSDWRRAQVNSALAPQLASLGYWQDALAMTRKIEFAAWRTEGLVGLLPYLPHSYKKRLLSEMFTELKNVLQTDPQTATLSRIAPQLAENNFPEAAISACEAIKDKTLQSRALIRMYPHLKHSDLLKTLSIAEAIEDEKWKADALVGLIPFIEKSLRDEVIRRAVEAILTIDERLRRQQLLEQISPFLSQISPTAFWILWQELLHLSAKRSRQDHFADLSALAIVIFEIGSTEAVTETVRAILDIINWWP